MKETILKKNKRLRWMALVVLFFVVILLAVLALNLVAAFSWESGGENTKAPFRYHEKANGSVIVKIDTSNYPDGVLEQKPSEEMGITVKEKRKSKKEHTYLISAERNISFVWTVNIYPDKKAKKAGNPADILLMNFTADAHGGLTVISGLMKEQSIPVNVENENYKYSYRMDDSGNLQVAITYPVNVSWKAEYNKKKITVEDTYDTAYSQIIKISPLGNAKEGDTKAEVCLYTTSQNEGADDKHTREIRFSIKLKDGVITDVSAKDGEVVNTESEQNDKRNPDEEYPEEEIPEEYKEQLKGH